MQVFPARPAIGPRIVLALKQASEHKAVVRVGLPIEPHHCVVPGILIRKSTALTRKTKSVPGRTDQVIYNRAVRGIQCAGQVCSKSSARFRAARPSGAVKLVDVCPLTLCNARRIQRIDESSRGLEGVLIALVS